MEKLSNKNQQIENKKINWNGFYSHAQWLRSEKNNDNNVLHYLNYFLLSPHLFEPNSIKYYYDTLSLLSMYYWKASNIHGLDWVYHTLLRAQKKNQKASPEIQTKIIIRYAHALNSEGVCLGFANQLLSEIGEISDQKIKEEYIKLKNDLDTKLKNNELQNNTKGPVEWNKFEEEDDYLNPYINTNNNGEENRENDNDIIDIQNESINIRKVLFLSNSHDLPILPRNVHYKSAEEFKAILFKLTNSQNYIILNENTNENILYLLFTFFEEKKLLSNELINIDKFLSSQNNNNSLLIIVSVGNLKVAEDKIPKGIKPFYDFSTTLLKLKTDPYSFTGKGFPNFGKSCFVNSGLQCILHCNKLTKYFSEQNEEEQEDEVMKSFIHLLKEMNEESFKESLRTFIKTFIKVKEKFSMKEKNDSPELVADILNHLGSATCRAKYELHDPSIYPAGSAEVSWEKLLSKEASIITDLFYGQLQHKYTCNCGAKVNYEEFLLLDIPVQNYFISFPFFKLDQKSNPKEIPLRVYYLKQSFLSGKYIRSEIKKNYDKNVDILVIDYNSSKVTLMKDDDNISKFTSKFFETNFEIILYEIDDQERYYLVPCHVGENKITNHSFQKITGYPIQICKKEDENELKGDFTYFFSKGQQPLDNNYKVISNGDSLYSFDTKSSFMTYVNNSKSKIFYTYSKNEKWERGADQLESNYPFLQECFDLLLNGQSNQNCKKCDHIKKTKTSFTKLPHYLIIYFKRFYFDHKSGKFCTNKIFINVPKKLTLNDDKKNPHNYEVFALNIFEESFWRRHYIADCKEKDQWYRFDDDNPKKSIDYDPNNGVLLAFYEKTS